MKQNWNEKWNEKKKSENMHNHIVATNKMKNENLHKKVAIGGWKGAYIEIDLAASTYYI